MDGSRETANLSKDDKLTTPTTDQGEEGRGTNTVKRRVNQILRSTELVQLHTAHRYFNDGTPEAGDVLGLLSGN